MGTFRIAKVFTIDTGHRLAKHPELCRFPHGHTYQVEVVLRAGELDENDMVCDYGALKAVVKRELERYDHAMVLSAADPQAEGFMALSQRVVVLPEGDPTAEVLARHLFVRLGAALRAGAEVVTESGAACWVPRGVRLERVRVWETPTSWAEYGEESGAGSRSPGSEA